LEPGLSQATTTATTGDSTVITPLTGGSFLASGSYQSDFRLIWDRGVGAGTTRYAIIKFAKALFAKYSITGAGTGEATIEVEVEARKDMTGGAVTDVPYLVEYRQLLG
jgi:hypothetical protein